MSTIVGYATAAVVCIMMLAMSAMLFASFREHPIGHDRRTRGMTRWLERCCRWTRRLGPPKRPASFNEPVITQAQARQMRQVPWNYSPSAPRIILVDPAELYDSEED